MEGIRPYKILVVDDEPEIVAFASALLRRHNYEVISTTKGKEALELIKLQKPDLVILDIMIPDMSGQEVAEAAANEPGCENIPIIFLTGILTKEEESRVKKTGKHSVLAKPVSSNDLLEAVKHILPGKNS